MKKRSWRVLRFGLELAGLGLLIGAALTGLRAGASDDLALIPASARKPAPDFTLTDVQGKPLTLSQYRGKVVLLDFWAVECGGCKVEIPWYVAFDRKYHSQGLQILGVDMYGESPKMIRPFMAESGMTYPVAVGNDALGAKFGLEAMPLTLLIDRAGRVAVSHAGIVDRAAFENDIEELLRRMPSK